LSCYIRELGKVIFLKVSYELKVIISKEAKNLTFFCSFTLKEKKMFSTLKRKEILNMHEK